MSALGLPVFDKSIETTNAWLQDIMGELGPDRQRAYHALRSVLHALRDRLTVNEAADLGAQLPVFVRGVYYEGWTPAKAPAKQRSRDEFVGAVQERIAGAGVPPINADAATRAVFAVLTKHCDPGEIADVGAQLPDDLRDMLMAA